MASHAFTNVLEIIPARALRALGLLLADGVAIYIYKQDS